MLFVSEHNPNLDLSYKPGLHGVRFVDGYCEVTRPRAVVILQSSWWRRRGIRPATEEPEPAVATAGDSTADPGDDVPDGDIDDVLTWVADDPDRAQRALNAEQAQPKPRSTLVAKLERIAAVEA